MNELILLLIYLFVGSWRVWFVFGLIYFILYGWFGNVESGDELEEENGVDLDDLDEDDDDENVFEDDFVEIGVVILVVLFLEVELEVFYLGIDFEEEEEGKEFEDVKKLIKRVKKWLKD